MRSTVFAVCLTVLLLGTDVLAATHTAAALQKPAGSPLLEALELFNQDALVRALDDLAAGNVIDKTTRGAYFAEIQAADPAALAKAVAAGDAQAVEKAEALLECKRKILLSAPILKSFDRVLLVKRRITHPGNGLPANFHGNADLPRQGWDNEIATLALPDLGKPLETIYKPATGAFVGDLKLHFDAERLLCSTTTANGRFGIAEVTLADGKGTLLPLVGEPGIDNYDGCYLPDENIIFLSTTPIVGVPCVRGGSHVGNLHRLERGTGEIRRLSFDQEHNWCPTMLSSGQLMYLRWEYSDLPHFVSRILFQSNPDGTGQTSVYGSNSYWPNGIFYAKEIPGQPSRFVGIVTGHHGVCRIGELVLFDLSKGRFEADGVVQRIPGYGQPVIPVIKDQLVDNSWPKFVHPFPLDDKHFLVSAQPTPSSKWGIYLVDVFDNLLLLKEEPGFVLFEPTPLKKTVRPPVIPSKVVKGAKEALLNLTDVYLGPGLKGVPRGTVKSLRLFTYHFSYWGMGGQIDRVGMDGPWDIKRVLGTVPVEPDGSAFFRVPANTPIAIQPLDAEGRALALMRSWYTAMPGEVQSCVGCHEGKGETPVAKATAARSRAPSAIQPWHGPVRGFSFIREVQPVLDRHCVGCHDGTEKNRNRPDFSDRPFITADCGSPTYKNSTLFPPSYLALRCYVRTPTMESDMHLAKPCEYHASNSRLFQMLAEGHHGVNLDAEARDRLYTWLDLNTPAHGTWTEIVGADKVEKVQALRREFLKKYAGLDDDPEQIVNPYVKNAVKFQPPAAGDSGKPAPVSGVQAPALTREEARRRQAALGVTQRTLEIAPGVRLELRRIPAGPAIAKPFWIGTFEVTNEQYAAFDPAHDSGIENGDFLQFSDLERGHPLNQPKQPVCRVSWQKARAFCAWLSQKTGKNVDLPSEMQWEHACRTGTETPMNYGGLDTDFSGFANLADQTFRRVGTLGWGLPSGAVPEWRPAIVSVDDKFRVSSPVGSFAANAWGLYDMHGNVAEWTRDNFAAPEHPASPMIAMDAKAVRGGSWYDRPSQATATYRLGYAPWQPVFNVGFRIVCEDSGE